MKAKKKMTDNAMSANRKNAQRSTGPKNTTRTSQNARTHGLLCKNLKFRNDEDRQEFEALLRDLNHQDRSTEPLGSVVIEDLAVAVWKLRETIALDLVELGRGRKAADAVITALDNADAGDQLLTADGETKKRRGWACSELTVRTAVTNMEKDELCQSANNKTGHVQMEAKLTTSLDTLLRYHSAIRRDMYRAIATLQGMQRDRKEA